jgi:tetratricopeptide (TPR) repeat protein
MLAMVLYWAVVLVVRMPWLSANGSLKVAIQLPWASAVTTAGNSDEARRYQEEARQLYQQVGDVWGVAIAYNNLGEISLKSGETATACALFSQALAAYQQADVPGGQAGALSNWGQACLSIGNLAGAARYFGDGLAIALAIGDRPVALEILVRTAVLWQQQTETTHHPLVLLTFALRQPELLAETRQTARVVAAALRAASTPKQVAAAEQEAVALDWQAIESRSLVDTAQD